MPSRPASVRRTGAASSREPVPVPHDEEIALRSAARAAEDEGDFAGARRLVLQLEPSRRREAWRQSLDEVLALGPAPPSWRLARWLVAPALRFGLGAPRQQIFERYATAVLQTLGLGSRQRALLAADRALDDPLVADAGLFDGRVFADYVECAAAAALLHRAGPVQEWRERPASAFELMSTSTDVAGVRDLTTGEESRAVLTGELAQLSPGTFLYGRLVPVSGSPGQVFALPPTVVDRLNAARIVRAVRRGAPPEERLRAAAAALRRGSG